VVLLSTGWSPLAKCLELAKKYVSEKNIEPKAIFDMDAKSLL